MAFKIFFLLLECFSFCSEVLVRLDKKRLDKKAKVNFKICSATNWIKNNQNTDIFRYIKQ